MFSRYVYISSKVFNLRVVYIFSRQPQPEKICYWRGFFECSFYSNSKSLVMDCPTGRIRSSMGNDRSLYYCLKRVRLLLICTSVLQMCPLQWTELGTATGQLNRRHRFTLVCMTTCFRCRSVRHPSLHAAIPVRTWLLRNSELSTNTRKALKAYPTFPRYVLTLFFIDTMI